MQTKRVKIEGKVQGVYFRASAKQKAMNLGVQGFVKNETDGSVVMEIEGKQQDVDSMVEWCNNGPALARVKNVHIENTAQRNFVNFEIKK